MTEGSAHPEIGPELRRLAQAILDRLDPAVRAAAAMATESLTGAGRCQQVWCPVCALAALVSGEQHPLLTVIAEHSVSLMTVVRTMAADPGASPPDRPVPEPPAPSNGRAPSDAAPSDAAPSDAAPVGGASSYQHIPIVIEQGGAPD